MNAPSQPANALEQRIYNLLRPFRNECYEAHDLEQSSEPATELAVKLERKMLVLAQNIVFLAHNHFANISGFISVSDLFVVMRGWTGDGVAKSGGAIAVLVRYEGGMMGVVKARFDEGGEVIEALGEKVDEMLVVVT